jgi:hypothetical protein
MNTRAILEVLGQLGMDTAGLTPDNLLTRISEQIVLKKFEGDSTDGESVETIVIKDGEICH